MASQRHRLHCALNVLCAFLLFIPPIAATDYDTSNSHKPRLFIITDISNEPDDAMSITRFLVYANQFRTEGLVACTSYWLPNVTRPDEIEKHIDAYGEVVNNLNAHVEPQWSYPTAQSLHEVVKSGPVAYGMHALEHNRTLSEGSELLIDALNASDEPLYVLCWGGTNTVAQALAHISATKPGAIPHILKKLRLYTISDQDDTGFWLRTNYPNIWAITSLHGFNQYGLATWTGISGEVNYGQDGGANTSLVSQDWLREHIQIGPLGKLYPDVVYIMEGDTPSLLYMIRNGLGELEHPEYGSWGGRYERLVSSLAAADGVAKGVFTDTTDNVTGIDGHWHRNNLATIWRWRDAYQWDFAARTQWTLSSNFSEANHAPVISLNGTSGLSPYRIDGVIGDSVYLDATGTKDPDGDVLTYSWYQYREVTATQYGASEVADLKVEMLDDEGLRVKVEVPDYKFICTGSRGDPMKKCRAFHVILEVKDGGRLRAYRRIIIQSVRDSSS